MKPFNFASFQVIVALLASLFLTSAHADNYIHSYFINNTPISVCGIQPKTKAELSKIIKGSTSNDTRGCSIDGIDTKLVLKMIQGIPSVGIDTPRNCIPTATEPELRTMTIIARDSNFELSTQIIGDEIDFSASLAPMNNFQFIPKSTFR
ncbi:hypothetical protein [Parashewanella tropica]|uniref:hypothetical protein n=1 Tax=Parashewanella tropica TaxID=2547970 RepID=UPI00105A77A6|nr:hypothetical protein [Parashewanella tropica]